MSWEIQTVITQFDEIRNKALIAAQSNWLGIDTLNEIVELANQGKSYLDGNTSELADALREQWSDLAARATAGKLNRSQSRTRRAFVDIEGHCGEIVNMLSTLKG